MVHVVAFVCLCSFLKSILFKFVYLCLSGPENQTRRSQTTAGSAEIAIIPFHGINVLRPHPL